MTCIELITVQEAGMHTTILISEKCAFEGTTRFEDGLRLPLGISVNFPSFAAGILTEVRMLHVECAAFCEQAGAGGIQEDSTKEMSACRLQIL